MEFHYDCNLPNIKEGFLEKANIGVFERWQRRYFRLQRRCLFYFKKDTDDEPCGNIPLIDIALEDLPFKKGRKFGFKIKIQGKPSFAKRDEYLIQADEEDTRKTWKAAILQNYSVSVVNQPYERACTITTTQNTNVHLLLPFFVPSFFEVLNNTGYKLRGVWNVEVPADIVQKNLALLDQNYLLPMEDIHAAVATFTAYLQRLPEPLLQPSNYDGLIEKITPERVRQVILEANAPARSFLRLFGLHLKKVLDNSSTNGDTQYSLQPLLLQLLLRSTSKCPVPPAQMRSIQEGISDVFLTNAQKIFEDVHQFLEAPVQPVIRKARLLSNISNLGDDILEGPRGLLVNIVREDNVGWCTCCTLNGRVGLLHKDWIKNLTPEEEAEMRKGPNIDAMLDAVREKNPSIVLLFDAMIDEIQKFKEFLDIESK